MCGAPHEICLVVRGRGVGRSLIIPVPCVEDRAKHRRRQKTLLFQRPLKLSLGLDISYLAVHNRHDKHETVAGPAASDGAYTIYYDVLQAACHRTCQSNAIYEPVDRRWNSLGHKTTNLQPATDWNHFRCRRLRLERRLGEAVQTYSSTTNPICVFAITMHGPTQGDDTLTTVETVYPVISLSVRS